MRDDQSAAGHESGKPYHHGDLRSTLIAVGRAVLAEEGVAGLDLRKVARRAGVSHAAPYRHFADKQALLAAIAEEGFALLAAQVQAALAAAPDDLQDQLFVLARAYVNFALANPAHMREMFSGLTIDRAAYPSLYDASKAAFGIIVGVIQAGQERGQLVAGDPKLLALAAWSLIHGLAMLLIEHQIPEAKGNPVVADQMIQVCLQTLYGGLGQR